MIMTWTVLDLGIALLMPVILRPWPALANWRCSRIRRGAVQLWGLARQIQSKVPGNPFYAPLSSDALLSLGRFCHADHHRHAHSHPAPRPQPWTGPQPHPRCLPRVRSVSDARPATGPQRPPTPFEIAAGKPLLAWLCMGGIAAAFLFAVLSQRSSDGVSDFSLFYRVSQLIAAGDGLAPYDPARFRAIQAALVWRWPCFFHDLSTALLPADRTVAGNCRNRWPTRCFSVPRWRCCFLYWRA